MRVTESHREFVRDNAEKMTVSSIQDNLKRKGLSNSQANNVVRNQRVKLGIYNHSFHGIRGSTKKHPEQAPGVWFFKRKHVPIPSRQEELAKPKALRDPRFKFAK